jgi:protein-S-isoprenylcysteine O-methyltransferase Ste14
MGVPVFNLIIGIFAGIFVARGAASAGEDEKSATARIAKVAWFATAVLAVVCAASAYFALSDSYTSANLSGMLGLNITSSAVNWIIVVGGVSLLTAQYWLTRFAGTKTLKKFGA